MKHWQKRRSLALLLLIVTLFTAAIPFTAAADETSSGTTGGSGTSKEEELYGGRTMEEILNLISGSTYDDYAAKNNDKTIASADRTKNPIILTPDAIVEEGDADFIDDKTGDERTTADYIIGTTDSFGIEDMPDVKGKPIDNAQVVFTPNSGKVTYKVVVPESGMYAIDLIYYPLVSLPQADGSSKVVSTKTTIERMFMIDGELPFNECRYLYIPRCWEYVGTDGKSVLLKEGQPNPADYQTQEAYDKAYDEWAAANGGGAGNYLWDKDIQNNDIRPDRLDAPEWRTY
ncbi:MAG: hypothetical protein IJY04_02315, partial [Clostridia bacterium]|nr:hypothetical protein [Clostridia bacterium]